MVKPRAMRVMAMLLAAGLASVVAAAQEPLMGSQDAPGSPAVAAQTAPVTAAEIGGEDGLYRFVVIGDFLAKGLGAGLTRQAEADARFEAENRFNEASGLARTAFYDWPSSVARLLDSSSFDAVVVMLGTNDRREIRDGTLRLLFGTPPWIEAYGKQVDALLSAITARGVKVYWVSPPPMADATFDADMQIIATIQRDKVMARGGTWIDLRKRLSNPDGTYVDSAETPEGFQRIRLRDGIGFLRLGNDVLAGIVMPELVAGAGAPVLAPSILPPDVSANAAQPPSGPLFGQPGVDDTQLSFDAASVVITPPQPTAAQAAVTKKPAGLDFALVPGSAAERFYLKGDPGLAPTGRFDDYVAPPLPTEQ
jgi:uncharacterized protein